jgi:hypothetical protein
MNGDDDRRIAAAVIVNPAAAAPQCNMISTGATWR